MLRLQKKIGIHRSILRYYGEFYGGGTWWSLSRTAISEIIATIESRKSLIPSLHFAFCAEEIFFQTVIMNSHMSSNVENNDLRYVDWSSKYGSCPAVLDETDFDNIINSGKLFARKIDSAISRTLMIKLEQQLAESHATR